VSVRLPSGGGRGDDDELLDRLGRGEPVEGGDVERMLSTWRASMPIAGPTDDRLLSAVTAAVTRPRRTNRRLSRTVATATAAAVLVGGTVTVVAAQAGPDSPLWPVTELVFGGLAESRAAQAQADDTLQQARTAVDEGRVLEATRLLAQADELADKVDEPGAADRIRAAIADLRAQLDRDAVRTPSRADASRQPAAPTTTVPGETEETEEPPADKPSEPSEESGSKQGPSVDVPVIDPPGLSERTEPPTPPTRRGSGRLPLEGVGR
jgi:hypothetical protein